jgi:hypothetical protein
MDNSTHEKFVKQRLALVENSKRRKNSNTKFYFLGALVGILLIAPLGSYLFLVQKIIGENSNNQASQTASNEEEVIVPPLEVQLTPIIEEVPGSTPSATPTITLQE